jgi:isopentenyldiphosphate isomerase
MEKEEIVQCDSNGKIIGPIDKLHAHSEEIRPKLTHYSTWSMIYHLPSGTYGIQLKNPKKHDKYGGGKWDMGVAGHNCYVKKGDTYLPLSFEESLVKEAEEEIGINITICDSEHNFINEIKASPKKPLGFIFEKFHYKTERNNEWVGLGFVVVLSKEVHFTDNEVIDFKWLKPGELKNFLENSTNYCDPLPLVFEKAEVFRNKHLELFK